MPTVAAVAGGKDDRHSLLLFSLVRSVPPSSAGHSAHSLLILSSV